MPLNAIGWSTEEDEKLAELVAKSPHLYNVFDPIRKNILARETTWQAISHFLSKPIEECKKRWRGLRDGYMRSKRVGTVHKSKAAIFEKLQFLDGAPMEEAEETETILGDIQTSDPGTNVVGPEQIVDHYYEVSEVTVTDDSHRESTADLKSFVKILPKADKKDEPPKKIVKKTPGGRKKAIPIPKNLTPVKILPKPLLMNGPKIVGILESKTPEQRSTIDKLVEKVLREHTNEIDVFFRSMAASVKKLQPSLVPKVKMEVCNVIAKYEMQNFNQ